MESIKTKRAVIVEKNKVELEEVEIVMKEDEVLIKNEVCGLCSSEIDFITGERKVDYPMPFGHEPAGRIIAIGKDIKNYKVGDRVTGFWMPGFSEYGNISAEKIILIPDNVKTEYALGEPLFCITNIIKMAAVEFGDFVMVVGCGGMGMAAIASLANSGAAGIIAVDVLDNKLELAGELGATVTINSAKENVVEKVMSVTKGHRIDVAIELTGRSNCIDIASTSMRRPRGRLLIASAHVEPQTCNMLVWAERSTIVYNAHPSYTMDRMDDLRRTMLMLGKGIFRMDKIITHRFTLDKFQDAVDTLLNKPADYIKGIVTMQ
ncbi:MAG: zinc-binding dehydrogenase [Clostridiales bacterium]|nr:zinc-binding dehydrogenase [Clostridiales bacterium]